MTSLIRAFMFAVLGMLLVAPRLFVELMATEAIYVNKNTPALS
jgi:hypothetical protein